MTRNSLLSLRLNTFARIFHLSEKISFTSTVCTCSKTNNHNKRKKITHFNVTQVITCSKEFYCQKYKKYKFYITVACLTL